MSTNEQYRRLPAVDELARGAASGLPHAIVVGESRKVIEELRARIGAGEQELPEAAELLRRRLAELEEPSLVRVINATGVILHTNLGRAPLVGGGPAEGYSNLEYDLKTGRRGKRDTHTAALLESLLGAPAIAVNNNAAAVYLALHELAAGGEVIVSRGELIEIGDGFRIPDIMAHSGARLVEVGTTNRTRIEDYRAALTAETRLLLRVHPSNFRVSGFTGRPSLEELTGLGREAGVAVYEDLGSGYVGGLAGCGVDEPALRESLAAGVDLISFSGDKLLGGPQAGILAGRAELIGRLRRNPMFRALRLDKLVIGALERTLRLMVAGREGEIPVYRMARASAEELRVRCARLVSEVGRGEIVEGRSLLGGGSTPELEIPSPVVGLGGDAVGLERRLRAGEPAVVARIEDGTLRLDLRTVDPSEDEALAKALRAALA